MMKCLYEQNDIFVAAMLRDAEQKGFPRPAWDRRSYNPLRFWLDTVIDPYGFFLRGTCYVPSQTSHRCIRDTCDCIHIPETLLQDYAVDNHLRKTKVLGNLIGVEIMQGQHSGTRERSGIDGHRVRKVNQIRLKPGDQQRKLAIVPEISTQRAL